MVKLPRLRIPPPKGWPKLPLLTSVRGRIITGFGLLIVILIAVVAGSAWLVRAHRADMAEMEDQAMMAHSYLQEIQVPGSGAIIALQFYIITGNEASVPLARAELAAAIDALDQAIAAEEASEHGEVLALLREIKAEAAPLREAFERIIALRRSGDVQGATEALDSSFLRLLAIVPRFEAAADPEQQRAAGLRAGAERTAEVAFWLLVVSGVAGAALGLAASIFIARSVLGPLSSLESAALAVAGGDLDARAPTSGPRELAHLGETFNQMTESLLDLNHSLEQRVEERTEALQDKTRQLLDARAQAATDGLTGLYNHRTFQEKVRREVSRAQKSDSTLGLVMLDIDSFKLVNDSLGHLAGDRILRDIAVVLTEVVGDGKAYRYGGDEFAVLLPGEDGERTAAIAEELRLAIEGRSNGSGADITVSLGVASFPGEAGSAEELTYGADAAMYWAKSAGKNRVGDWGNLFQHRDDGSLPWFAADRGVKAPDVIAALVAALAAKDPVTSAHTERCSWYAIKLAEELGLGADQRSIVGTAALLHDIGKLAVPDEVLFKPGPLNQDEWAQMKQHPTAALHVLSQIRSVADATPAILHHHEHFDGSGYPDGLAGEGIPIASRILLVGDAFDAMTTDRPYRKAMPVEEAIAELERHAGGQFDPEIVAAFLRILSREGPRPLFHAANSPTAATAVRRAAAEPNG